MARATAAGSHSRSSTRRAAQHGTKAAANGRGSTARALAVFGLVGALIVAGAVLLLRQGLGRPPQMAAPAPPVASLGAPGAEVNWKVKGSSTAPVLVEEWGDFQ